MAMHKAPGSPISAVGKTDPPLLPYFCFGMDIGGSLCKLVYFQRTPPTDGSESSEDRAHRERLQAVLESREAYGETGARDAELEFDDPIQGGHFHLMRFETRKMERFLDMAKQQNIIHPGMVIGATGGGARKYATVVRETLGFDPVRGDELQCLISGINFCLGHSAQNEIYSYDLDDVASRSGPDSIPSSPSPKHYLETSQLKFPYLLVNIGSGVSMMQVNSDGTHKRVGGTSLGGATFLSLACIVTGCSSFPEALALAEKGKAAEVDLLVGDIYGGDYSEFDLPSDTVAASLGKCIRPNVREGAKPEDLARALLDTVTNNIGSIAMLHARSAGVNNIVFAGSFLRHNNISIARLSSALQYWSKGALSALFLRHEGYLGAIGALTLAGAQAAATVS